MRSLYLVLIIPVLVCTMASCVVNTQQKLQEVRDGLDATIAQLPSSSYFDIVTVLSGESSSTDYGETCYYGQAGIAIGTSLSGKSALETYVDELQLRGWVIEQSDLERSMVLIRGEHERVSVSLDGPGWIIEMDEGYQRAKDAYATFIFATVTFILPNREGC